jgi:hypothetical protein
VKETDGQAGEGLTFIVGGVDAVGGRLVGWRRPWRNRRLTLWICRDEEQRRWQRRRRFDREERNYKKVDQHQPRDLGRQSDRWSMMIHHRPPRPPEFDLATLNFLATDAQMSCTDHRRSDELLLLLLHEERSMESIPDRSLLYTIGPVGDTEMARIRNFSWAWAGWQLLCLKQMSLLLKGKMFQIA